MSISSMSAKKPSPKPSETAPAGEEAKAQKSLPDYRVLRKLPKLDDVFGKEMKGGMAVFNKGRPKDRDKWYDFGNEIEADPAIMAITEQWWPEMFDSLNGGCATVEPEDGQKLEALCEMFGVPLKLKTSTSEMFRHAYGIFVICFASAVRHELERPTYLRRIKTYWEPGWVEYIEAVAYGRREEARKWARELRVLYSDGKYPTHSTAGLYKAPPEMDSGLDALWAIEDAKAK